MPFEKWQTLVKYLFDCTLCALFKLLTALLKYLNLLQGAALRFAMPMIMTMIMIEIQYSGTALLLLVNPCIPHQNNHTVRPTCVFIV